MPLVPTPVITDSVNTDFLRFADEVASFLEDEKLKAQGRIKNCEIFINDVSLKSESLKEGLISLRQHAEEDYSTLLHLERVLNMRECGDFVAKLETLVGGPEHKVYSGGDSYYTMTSSSSCQMEALRMHENGTGFFMDRPSGSGSDDEEKKFVDVCDNFDPLADDEGGIGGVLTSAMTIKKAEPVKKSSKNRPKGSATRVKFRKQHPSNAENLDDVDEEPTDLPSVTFRNSHRSHQSHPSLTIARSLPVSVPMTEFSKRKLRSSYFACSDEDGSDDEDSDQHLPTDIPAKIAELAKSLYAEDMLGDLPSPRREHRM